MAAQLLRLRLALLGAAFPRPGRGSALRATGGVLVLIAVAGVCVAVARLADAPASAAEPLTVLVGAAASAGFLLVPLLVGAEDPLDPRRFAVLGASRSRLGWQLLPAMLVSASTVLLVAVVVTLTLVWTAHGAGLPVALLAAALGTATALLAARVAMAVGALALRARRSPHLTGLLVGVAAAVLLPASAYLVVTEQTAGVPDAVADAAEVASLTPFGAAWALPWAGGGAWTPTLVIAVVTPIALLGLWHLLVRRLLTTLEKPVPARVRSGLGWFAVMPPTPGGAVAARSLVYWFADPRHIADLIVVPLVAALAVVPLLVVGVPAEFAVLAAPPLMALFAGWIVHNDLAYDSTGIWMHIASGVQGAADRVGRLIPVVIVAVPLLAVAVTLAVLVHGDAEALPLLVGVCASLFLSGLGLSSLSSALAPYAVARPGDGVFRQPQRTGGAAAQALVLLGVLAASAPALWWAWEALQGDRRQGALALWGGVGIGAAVLVAGVAAGGLVFRRRASRIMEFAETT